jgi:CDP-diacylglycerol--serine O-phosphatidyltransferase
MADSPSALAVARDFALKKIAILPTLFTLGNAVCGLTALVCAAHISVAQYYFSQRQAFYLGGALVFIAMLFDVFDGYLARRTKAASQFGAELDSLCDAISFGVVPAFLLMRLGEQFEGRIFRDLYFGVGMLYLCCTVLRLARFNVHAALDAKAHRSFLGLPSPAAAGCIAALVVVRFNFTEIRWVPDELMDHFIPIFAPFAGVQIVLLLFGVYLFRELALLVLFWGYAAYGPLRLAFRRAPAADAALEAPAQAP